MWFDKLVAAGASVLQNKYTLQSNWGSLNSGLFGHISPCDKDGNLITGGVTVSAPLIESADLQQQFNWQSPFENYSLDTRHPTLMAALQTNLVGQVTEALTAVKGEDSMISQAMKPLADVFAAAEGRTGITKLNSRQVFIGHEPLKIDITMAFRAYSDPVKEVEMPINALMEMPYPPDLAEDVASAAASKSEEGISAMVIEALFPSVAPSFVSFTYKGKTYKPMVIESISRPLINPYSSFGDIYATVQISLGSFRSLDMKDMKALHKNPMSELVDSTIAGMGSLFKK